MGQTASRATEFGSTAASSIIEGSAQTGKDVTQSDLGEFVGSIGGSVLAVPSALIGVAAGVAYGAGEDVAACGNPGQRKLVQQKQSPQTHLRYPPSSAGKRTKHLSQHSHSGAHQPPGWRRTKHLTQQSHSDAHQPPGSRAPSVHGPEGPMFPTAPVASSTPLDYGMNSAVTLPEYSLESPSGNNDMNNAVTLPGYGPDSPAGNYGMNCAATLPGYSPDNPSGNNGMNSAATLPGYNFDSPPGSRLECNNPCNDLHKVEGANVQSSFYQAIWAVREPLCPELVLSVESWYAVCFEDIARATGTYTIYGRGGKPLLTAQIENFGSSFASLNLSVGGRGGLTLMGKMRRSPHGLHIYKGKNGEPYGELRNVGVLKHSLIVGGVEVLRLDFDEDIGMARLVHARDNSLVASACKLRDPPSELPRPADYLGIAVTPGMDPILTILCVIGATTVND